MMFLLSLSLLSPALAGKIRNPTVVEDALAYAETDRAKALTLLEDAVDGAKKNEAGVIALYAGEQRRLNGDRVQATAWFDKALALDDSLEPAVTLGRVLLDVDKGLDARGIATLGDAPEKEILQTQNADRYLLLALLAAKENDAARVKSFSKKAIDAARVDAGVLQRITVRLQELAGTAPDDVQLTEGGGGSPLDRAREALAKGDRSKAANLAQKAIDDAAEGSPEALRASYMLKRANATTPVDPGKIAVLLPQSGKYQLVGRQIEEALRYGYQREGGKAKLVFIDSGATPEEAVAALERAVLQEGAIAIAGPVLSVVADEVITAADALEVPLLSLSQSNELAGNPWVFQGVPSVGDQIEALVTHEIGREHTKFGIFAPDTAAGHRAAEVFRASVARHGGSVTGETFYDAEAKALMPFAAKLGGKDPKARSSELYRLREEARENGRDPSTVVLPPRVDFQAIFIPDNARNVALAAAALAYEEFSIGQFRAKKGATTMSLIGLSGWNHQSLVTSGNEYVRDSRFTDIYDPAASADFERDYHAALKRGPSSLEAAVVDAGRLLAKGTASAATTRAQFAEGLAKVQVEGTNTGATGFAEDHRAKPKIQILTIGYNGIQAAE